MSRPGRPPKLTPELSAAFCRRLAEGLSRAKAARLAGVTPKSVCGWLRVGRGERSGRHARFRADVLAAEAGFVAARLAEVVRAAEPRPERVTRTATRPDGALTVTVIERPGGDWRAAAWLLACKAPDEYGSARHELRALRRELAELRRMLADRASSR